MVAREGVSGITPPPALTRVAPLFPAPGRLVRLLVVALLMAPAAWGGDGADASVDPYADCPEQREALNGCQWGAGCGIQVGTPSVGKDYLRCGEVTTVTAPSTVDFDHCTLPFPHGPMNHTACTKCLTQPPAYGGWDTVQLTPSWDDGGAGGTFGHLDGAGNFVPGGDISHYRSGPEPGVVNVRVTFDDLAVLADDPPASATVALTNVEFTITPCPAEWVPVDGANLSFTAEIRPTTDHRGQSLASQITFHLSASRVSGYCMNRRRLRQTEQEPALWNDTDRWDQGVIYPNSDLRFPPDQPGLNVSLDPTNMYLVAETTTAVTTATIQVACLDYGAFGGSLRAEAVIANTLRHARRSDLPAAQPPVESVAIPVDENGNHIADAATAYDLRAQAAANPNEDADSAPRSYQPNANFIVDTGAERRGDGLTRYEEYRGAELTLEQGGGHQRFDVTLKDVFIYTAPNYWTLLDLSIFSTDLDPIVVHRVDPSDVDFIPLPGFDDDGDGQIGEDDLDGVDNDLDGRIDEDWPEAVIPDSERCHMTLNRYTALEHSESSMSATRLMPSDGPFLGRFDGTMIHRGYAGIGVFYIRWHSNPHRSEVIAGDPPDQPCFRRVVAHELGNLLGMLDHDRNPNCVMYDDPNMNDHQRVNDPQPTEYADDNPPSELLWGI